MEAQAVGNVPMQIGPVQGSPGPETAVGSHFMVFGGPTEILLVIGRSRVIHLGDGSPTQGIEWTSSFSLSPVAAKQLAQGLTMSVEAWEKESNVVLKVPQAKITTPKKQPRKPAGE